jgi:hypothetical protein
MSKEGMPPEAIVKQMRDSGNVYRLTAAQLAELHDLGVADPVLTHGYYFQMLTKQGEHAKDGVKDYIVDGKMTDGFAFLVYPAEYAASGVMSFIVDQDGIVYQKDLGPNTDDLAKTLREYNPDKTWERVE